MKKTISLLLSLLSFSLLLGVCSFADSHSFQALHPYWGNNEYFQKHYSKYTAPVSVEVNKFDGDFDDPEVLYIYTYIINQATANRFTLDISCLDSPNAVSANRISAGNSGMWEQDSVRSARKNPKIALIHSITADPVLKNPVPHITWQNRVTWKLQPYKGRQVMWFYTSNPPMVRTYYLDTIKKPINDGLNTGVISRVQGPSCIAEKPKDSYPDYGDPE